MIGTLHSTGWASGSSVAGTDRAKTWTLDRNFDQAEGERLFKAGNFQAAEGFLTRAAADAEARKRSASRRVHLRLMLAEALRKQYRVDSPGTSDKLLSAEGAVRGAIEIAAANSDRDLYIRCLDELADIFSGQGNYAAVEKCMQEAIKLEASLSRPDPLRMGRRVLRLGVARHRLGKLDDAIPTLEKAVEINEQTFGLDHDETANHLTELGAALRANGNHELAQMHLRRALKIHERQGLDSPAAIRDLHHLAGSLEEAGDLDGAAAEYERALAYKHRVIGSDLDDLAELQYGLASLYIEWENYSRARELLYEAIGTFRNRGGLRLCVAYETMAYVEECSGRYDDAVKELTLAGKVWEKLNPPRTADLLRNLERRAEILEMIRKRSEASYLRERIETVKAVLEEERRAAGFVEPELADWPLDENAAEETPEPAGDETFGQLLSLSDAVGHGQPFFEEDSFVGEVDSTEDTVEGQEFAVDAGEPQDGSGETGIVLDPGFENYLGAEEETGISPEPEINASGIKAGASARSANRANNAR